MAYHEIQSSFLRRIRLKTYYWVFTLGFMLYYYVVVKFDNKVDKKLNSRACNRREFRLNYIAVP